MKKLRAGILAFGIIFLVSECADAQMAQQYRQAANLWRSVSCSVPADQSCANQNASYCDCLANQLGPGGGSLKCSAPSCSTASCGSSGSSAGANSSPVIPPANTGNAKADAIFNGLGLLIKWKMDHDAAKNAPNSQQEPKDTSAEDTLRAQAEEQQRINNEAAELLTEANSVQGSPVPAQSAASPSSTIDALLDSSAQAPPNNVASQVGNLLASSAPVQSIDPSTADAVASLLDPSDPTSDPSSGQADQQAALPTLQQIDQQESEEATSAGQAWGDALSKIKDFAADEVRDLTDPANLIASQLPDDDYLKSGAQETMKYLLPKETDSEVTLGSIVKDKVIDMASDKVADSLTDSKDDLACSGTDSDVDHAGCMVLLSPTNLARGFYNYGKILVSRLGTLMDTTNAALWGQSAQ
jgi:hypothetical protein